MARISRAQLALLRRAHEEGVHVYADPPHAIAKGISGPTLHALVSADLITLGDFTFKEGRRLNVTTKGVALLAQLASPVSDAPAEEG